MLKNPSAQPEPSVGVGMPPISSSQLPPTSNRPPSRQHISETAPKSNERQTDQSQSSQASSSRHTTPNMDADHLRTTTDGENDEGLFTCTCGGINMLTVVEQTMQLLFFPTQRSTDRRARARPNPRHRLRLLPQYLSFHLKRRKTLYSNLTQSG